MMGAAVTGLATLLLLFAEWRGSQAGKWLCKPVASAGFVCAAIEWGALEDRYGRTVLAALALSLIGDVLLIPKSKAVFRAGILAFLCGHLAYLAAFVIRGIEPRWALLAAVVLLPLAIGVGRKLLAHVQGGLRGAVLAYIAVISLMVCAASGTRTPLVIAGAVAFYLSDLSVARDRFVHKSFANRLWGLPLYYGAQLILAFSVVRPDLS
jgi:uncharacterized membrane protein YhhN